MLEREIRTAQARVNKVQGDIKDLRDKLAYQVKRLEEEVKVLNFLELCEETILK